MDLQERINNLEDNSLDGYKFQMLQHEGERVTSLIDFKKLIYEQYEGINENPTEYFIDKFLIEEEIELEELDIIYEIFKVSYLESLAISDIEMMLKITKNYYDKGFKNWYTFIEIQDGDSQEFNIITNLKNLDKKIDWEIG